MGNHLILIDKETLLKLAQPTAKALLALAVLSLPLTVKAYADRVRIDGEVTVTQGSGYFHILGCN